MTTVMKENVPDNVPDVDRSDKATSTKNCMMTSRFFALLATSMRIHACEHGKARLRARCAGDRVHKSDLLRAHTVSLKEDVLTKRKIGAVLLECALASLDDDDAHCLDVRTLSTATSLSGNNGDAANETQKNLLDVHTLARAGNTTVADLRKHAQHYGDTCRTSMKAYAELRAMELFAMHLLRLTDGAPLPAAFSSLVLTTRMRESLPDKREVHDALGFESTCSTADRLWLEYDKHGLYSPNIALGEYQLRRKQLVRLDPETGVRDVQPPTLPYSSSLSRNDEPSGYLERAFSVARRDRSKCSSFKNQLRWNVEKLPHLFIAGGAALKAFVPGSVRADSSSDVDVAMLTHPCLKKTPRDNTNTTKHEHDISTLMATLSNQQQPSSSAPPAPTSTSESARERFSRERNSRVREATALVHQTLEKAVLDLQAEFLKAQKNIGHPRVVDADSFPMPDEIADWLETPNALTVQVNKYVLPFTCCADDSAQTTSQVCALSLQFLKRSYTCEEQVLLSFDQAPCRLGVQDDDTATVTATALFALYTGCYVPDPEMASKPSRVVKYCDKLFTPLLPCGTYLRAVLGPLTAAPTMALREIADTLPYGTATIIASFILKARSVRMRRDATTAKNRDITAPSADADDGNADYGDLNIRSDAAIARAIEDEALISGSNRLSISQIREVYSSDPAAGAALEQELEDRGYKFDMVPLFSFVRAVKCDAFYLERVDRKKAPPPPIPRHKMIFRHLKDRRRLDVFSADDPHLKKDDPCARLYSASAAPVTVDTILRIADTHTEKEFGAQNPSQTNSEKEDTAVRDRENADDMNYLIDCLRRPCEQFNDHSDDDDDGDFMCCICRSALWKDGIDIANELHSWPCDHTFHTSCIAKYIATVRHAERCYHSTFSVPCPMCKTACDAGSLGLD